WQIRGRLAVGDRARLHQKPAPTAVRMDEFVEETGLPHARLADDSDDLAEPSSYFLERPSKFLHLGVPPDETGESASRRRLEPGACHASADELVDFNRLSQPL